MSDELPEDVKYQIDKGQLIEAGWLMFKHHFVKDNTTEGLAQRFRIIFFLGARYMLETIPEMADNEEDFVAKMDLIKDEFDRFIMSNFKMARTKH